MEEPDIFDLIMQRREADIVNLLSDPWARRRAMRGLTGEGLSPLHFAIMVHTSASHSNHHLSLGILLQMTEAAHAETVLNVEDSDGLTALDLACHNGLLSIVARLIVFGARLSTTYRDSLGTEIPKQPEGPHRTMLTILWKDQDCARLAAYLLTGNEAALMTLADQSPALVNRIAPLTWFILIDYALLCGQDETVAALLWLLPSMRMAEVFFRAWRHGAPATMLAALRLAGNDRRILVIRTCVHYYRDGAFGNAHWLFESYCQLKDVDLPPPDPRYGTGLIDAEDLILVDLPTGCSLAIESEQDMTAMEDAEEEEAVARLLTVAAVSEDGAFLQLLTGNFEADLCAEALIGTIDNLYNDAQLAPIRLCASMGYVARTGLTHGLVKAILDDNRNMILEFLRLGADPNCRDNNEEWLPLTPMVQNAQPHESVLYQCLLTDPHGAYPDFRRNMALCLVAHGAQIEFWPPATPENGISFLCTAAERGDIVFIQRAVGIGANPARLLNWARLNHTHANAQEAVKTALVALEWALMVFQNNTGSISLMNIVREGYLAGPNGDMLLIELQHLQTVQRGADFADCVRKCYGCVRQLLRRDYSLFRLSAMTIMEHGRGDVIDTTPDIVRNQIRRFPDAFLAACAGPRHPTLMQLLAWCHICLVEGLAGQLDLAWLMEWYGEGEDQV